MQVSVSWPQLKDFIDDRGARLQCVKAGASYHLVAFDGQFSLTSVIKNSDEDFVDFETNYLPSANCKLVPLDSDGSKISRTKVTKAGWRYDPRSLDWVTSKAASLYNKKPTGYSVANQTDIGDAVIKFYDASGTLLTKGESESDAEFQTRLDTDCTATAVNWQATYDMDMIGATITVRDAPTNDAYLWAIVAPDIPEYLGGRATFGNGGFNLSHLNSKDKIEVNGRGVKTIYYDPVYYTNKFQFLTVHEAGAKIGLQLFVEHYHG